VGVEPGVVALAAAGSDLAATVRNLNQLYLHDLSESAGWDVAEATAFWLSIITELTAGRFTNYRVDRPEPVQVQAFTYPAQWGPHPVGLEGTGRRLNQ
jgi:hypothetical protein